MTIHLRPIRHDDREGLVRFYGGLSAESLHARFFDACSVDAAVASSPVDVDGLNTLGVIAELEDEIVGVAHCFRLGHTAEVALAVRDDLQGHGIGTRLLEFLAASARASQVDRFVAEVLSDNRAMLDVFRGFRPDVTSATADGIVHVSFSI